MASDDKTPIQLLGEMAEALNQAEGAADQMIKGHRLDPSWIMIRDALELTKQGVALQAKIPLHRKIVPMV